jgi:hypothetical protein
MTDITLHTSTTPTYKNLIYSWYNKNEKITKVADWTNTIPTNQDSFSIVDRQNIHLKKNMMKSLKPLKKQVVKKRFEHVPKLVKREPSIKVGNWKLIQEFDFHRMQALYYEYQEPVDMYVLFFW